MRKTIIGVIGGSKASVKEAEAAERAGELIGRRGWILVTGGLTGVMEAASRGASKAGGTVVGIVPQADPSAANRFVDISVATNMGHARNAIIAHTAQALIAIGGAYGTLSEIALARAAGKPVLGIGTWDIKGVTPVADADAALDECERIFM
ncbi:MAG: TIGR00725 family protein [Proteobacteria bacterium]|nr:TIGR00725 family protein [Pseudomonadota bacterium]